MNDAPKKLIRNETKWGVRFSNSTVTRVWELRGRYDTTTEGFINKLVLMGLEAFNGLSEDEKDEIAAQVADWDNARSHEYRKPVNFEGRLEAIIKNSTTSAEIHKEQRKR